MDKSPSAGGARSRIDRPKLRAVLRSNLLYNRYLPFTPQPLDPPARKSG